MSSRFTLACLDMAGTTISDDGIVEEAAAEALALSGVEPGTVDHERGLEVVRSTMGQSKIAVFRRILGVEDRAVRANLDFETAYAQRVEGGRVRPLPGAAEAVKELRASGLTVAFTTGFSAVTQHALLEALGWLELADLALTPGEGLRGRPSPDLVLRAALLSGVDDVRQIVVAGDSVSDMGCGVSAGAGMVAGILGGAHSAEALVAAGATHVLTSIAELPQRLSRL